MNGGNPAPDSGRPGKITAPLNILLIEDNTIDAEMVGRLLGRQRLGIKGSQPTNVIHVGYFQQGLEVLSQNKNIDIVILDLHLPDGEGRGLVQRLNEQHSDVPVVVMTGLDVDESMGVELVRQGAEDYVSKDAITENSLQRSIRYAIERRSLGNQLKQQSEILKENNRELESFAYIASHDLRAPLINIKGFASELKHAIDDLTPLLKKYSDKMQPGERASVTGLLSKNIPQALGFIQSSADKMNTLISALLQYSRLGKRKLAYEKIDANELVRRCIETIQHQIRSSGARVIAEPLPEIIADRLSIEQVFSNLLDNSIKYLDPRRAGEIRIAAMEDKKGTIFSVTDNGVGIAEDDAQKVFEIFRRGAVSAPGEGIGLANTRAIVRRHDGDVWFESVHGKGSTFFFNIPFELPPDKDLNNDE
ncbi:MAG TPA: hybrid sensor histidine kinase/response regulator [Gammaproteobacteria bacterium]|nr:hybrid sensor histidine kinase/response regulator [Gammaproteobacteria bacterium]